MINYQIAWNQFMITQNKMYLNTAYAELLKTNWLLDQNALDFIAKLADFFNYKTYIELSFLYPNYQFKKYPLFTEKSFLPIKVIL